MGDMTAMDVGLGMATGQVWDGSFLSQATPNYIVISHPRYKPRLRQVDWFPSLLAKGLITLFPPHPRCPLSLNPNLSYLNALSFYYKIMRF